MAKVALEYVAVQSRTHIDDYDARKGAVRREALAARRMLGADKRARASEVICGKIRRLPAFVNARAVLAFAPMEEEVDLRPLLNDCRRGDGDARKKVALPRILSFARREMSLHWVGGEDELVPGPRGIMQPQECAPRARAEELDFWIVPAVAADKFNRRLGYGGGFYDTLLNARRAATVCAAVFDCQVVAEVPETAHDRRADLIITEQSK